MGGAGGVVQRGKKAVKSPTHRDGFNRLYTRVNSDFPTIFLVATFIIVRLFGECYIFNLIFILNYKNIIIAYYFPRSRLVKINCKDVWNPRGDGPGGALLHEGVVP